MGKFYQHGISRKNRMLPALDPSYVLPDERDLGDLIHYTQQVARAFRYYNFSDLPDGDWSDFFKEDISFVLASIVRFDLSKYKELYKSAKRNNDPALNKKLHEIILEVIGALEDWNAILRKIPGEDRIRVEISQTISHLKPYAQKLFTALTLQQVMASIHAAIPAVAVAEAWKLGFDAQGSNKRTSDSLDAADVFREFERSIEFIRRLAAERFNESLEKAGDRNPSAVLFIAFLKLFGHAQETLNGLTQRHLDYYYRQVIGQEPLSTIRESTVLCFEIPGQAQPVTIPAGSTYYVTQEDNPQEYGFVLDKPLYVGKSTLRQIEILYLEQQVHILSEYAGWPDIATIKPYRSSPLNDESLSEWAILGESQQPFGRDSRTMEDANLGFIIASDLLEVVDSDSVCCVRLQFTQESFGPQKEQALKLAVQSPESVNKSFRSFLYNYAAVLNISAEYALYKLLSNAIELFHFADDQWFRIEGFRLSAPDLENKAELSIEWRSDNREALEHPPAFAEINFPELGNPFIVVRLDSSSPLHPYIYFKDMELEAIEIETSYSDFRDFKIFNQQGYLDQTDPFFPYGAIPKKGDFFGIESNRVFNSNLSKLDINLRWFNLPEIPGGYAGKLKDYGIEVKNEDYEVAITSRSTGGRRTEGADVEVEKRQLFELYSKDETPSLYLSNKTRVEKVDLSKIHFSEVAKSKENAREASLLMELLGPDEGFGHAHYPQAIIDQVYRLFRKKEESALPSTPEAPQLEYVSIDFSLKKRFVLAGKKISASAESKLDFHHLGPFGVNDTIHGISGTFSGLLPVFDSARGLYLSLEQLEPGKVVSVGIQLSTANFQHTLQKTAKLTWWYLKQSGWAQLPVDHLLSDSTLGFLQSGVLRIQIPEKMNALTDSSGTEQYWFRITSDGNTELYGKVLAIQLNAAEVFRADDDNENILSGLTESWRIGGVVDNVATPVQFLPFRGGLPAEAAEQFYERVSERIAHRARPLRATDFEQLVLSQFPQIQIVKCFGNLNDDQLLTPDTSIQLVVIGGSGKGLIKDARELQVDANTLKQIRAFLSDHVSPFVNIEVSNPVFEEIRVVASMVFRGDKNQGEKLKQIDHELSKFISPWVYDESTEVEIGTYLAKESIRAFLIAQPSVEAVKHFSVIHTYRVYDPDEDYWLFELKDSQTETDGLRTISPSSVFSVLVSSEEHALEFVAADKTVLPQAYGFGNMRIGEDFTLKEDLSGIKEVDKRDNSQTEKRYAAFTIQLE